MPKAPADPTKPAARSLNVIAMNWRGEYPLWVSYWVFNFLGLLAIGALGIGIAAAFSSELGYNPYRVFAVYASVWALSGSIIVWQLVGIWRSSSRYVAEKRAAGHSGFWGGAAKVGVFLGAARFFLTLATSGAPQLTEAWNVAFLDDPDIPPYAIRIMRAGTEVEVAGGFKYGLHSDFERILKAAPQVKVVHLNSLGGRIGEAEKLYETIKTKGLVTYTSTHCISACTLAFAAGKSRWILRGAKLGISRPDISGLVPRGHRRGDFFAEEAARCLVGVEAAFAGRAMATPNADVWFPSEPELKAASVISGVASADDFAASGYGANVTRDVVVTKLKQAGTLYVALEQADPTTFSRIADKFY